MSVKLSFTVEELEAIAIQAAEEAVAAYKQSRQEERVRRNTRQLELETTALKLKARVKKEHAKRYVLHKEKILAQNKEWHDKNIERVNLKQLEYRIRNKEKLALYAKEYRLKNKDVINARRRQNRRKD